MLGHSFLLAASGRAVLLLLLLVSFLVSALARFLSSYLALLLGLWGIFDESSLINLELLHRFWNLLGHLSGSFLLAHCRAFLAVALLFCCAFEASSMSAVSWIWQVLKSPRLVKQEQPGGPVEGSHEVSASGRPFEDIVISKLAVS